MLWGILEQHWNGSLLDSVDALIQFARTMTWKGKHPRVELVTSTYQTGIKLTKKAMQAVETHLKRLPSLEKWFVDIRFSSTASRDINYSYVPKRGLASTSHLSIPLSVTGDFYDQPRAIRGHFFADPEPHAYRFLVNPLEKPTYVYFF